MPLILTITYRNEVIVIAMHEVIAVVRIANFVISFEFNPHNFIMGKPNIIVPLNLAITYRNEVIVIAMHKVIADFRIANSLN